MPSARPTLPPALFLVAVVVALTATAAGAPPPQSVCGVCGGALETAAAEEEVSLDVVNSTLDVTLDDDGHGRWEARVTVDDASRLSDRSLRDRIVRATYERGRTVVDAPANLTTAVDGDTLVVRFTVRQMAHRSVGDVLVVDYFRGPPTEGQYRIEADSVTVRGPAGTVPTRVGPRATTADGAAVWTTDATGPLWLDGETYLAFAPSGGVVGTLTTVVTVTVTQASIYGSTVVALGSLPALVLGIALVTMTRFERRLSAWAYDLDVDRRSLLRWTGGLAVALGVGGTLALLVAPAFTGALFALPAVLFPLYGALTGRSRWPRLAVVGAILATPFLVATTLVPLGPLGGLALGWLALVPWTLAVAVVGGLCYVSVRASVRTNLVRE